MVQHQEHQHWDSSSEKTFILIYLNLNIWYLCKDVEDISHFWLKIKQNAWQVDQLLCLKSESPTLS